VRGGGRAVGPRGAARTGAGFTSSASPLAKFVGFNRAPRYAGVKDGPAMRTTQSLSITLPHEMAQMVKAKVASGEYATESEVIRDGLRTLAARDAAVEKWLREEVVPTLEEAKRDPFQLIESADVLAMLKAHMGKPGSGS
jgi:putative addiction module CopG family antidote